MKKSLIVCMAALGAMIPGIGESNAQIIVGSGPDSSYLVIEAAEYGSPIVYEYRYNYAVDGPFDSTVMLQAVDAAISEISFTLLFGGTFLDAITYNTQTLTNEFLPPYSPFWAHWVSGGESGAPLAPMPAGVWSEGFGLANREVQPGSWDGFIFNGSYNSESPYNVISAPPSVAPIPEPSALYLCAAGLFLTFLRAKKRFHVG